MKYIITAFLFCFAGAYSQTYVQARTGIAAGDDIENYELLKSHPLYAYLAADYYQQYLHMNNEIISLFDNFFSAPPVKKLHNKWIRFNFNKGNFKLIVENYYDTGSTTSNCIYRDAQLSLGNRKEALRDIKHVWLSPNSMPKECDSVFNEWPGKNDPKNILSRAKKAYFAGNGRFAQAMAAKLNNESSQAISLFAEFLSTPTLITNYSVTELSQTSLHRDLLPLALEKLVRIDSSQYAGFAMQFAQQLQGNKDYQKMLKKLTHYLANRQDRQAEQTYALLTSPDKDAGESLLRLLVGARDWVAIKKLVSVNNTDSMSLYWLGRSVEALGGDASTIYKKAAKVRSYYGFMAADKLGLPYSFNAEAIKPDVVSQSNFNKNSNLIRGKLLYQFNEPNSAKQEILPLAKKMDTGSQRQLAYWLSQQGFHHDAIYVLGKLRDWNDIYIRFPTPYDKQVAEANRITGTESTWIYAIIRQESSMNPRAVSRARAKGLMQLIPSTARRMASDLGLSLAGNGIFNPDTNTKMGAEYLAQMYRRFGNVALASAAYNAGPGRVNQWTVNGISDMPIWIESIPFDETRKYVKRIVEYQQVYAKHMNKKIPTVTEILNHREALMQPQSTNTAETQDADK
ncbi:MAG: lytic transglycosylase domain-containing protein [Gammaproteobacteria bacterium]|nr:lytic transglycosylase domain-containing protein [Gammaproteobacteria bacterium]